MASLPIPKNTSALAAVLISLLVSCPKTKNDFSTCPPAVPMTAKASPPGGKIHTPVAILRIGVTGSPIEP